LPHWSDCIGTKTLLLFLVGFAGTCPVFSLFVTMLPSIDATCHVTLLCTCQSGLNSMQHTLFRPADQTCYSAAYCLDLTGICTRHATTHRTTSAHVTYEQACWKVRLYGQYACHDEQPKQWPVRSYTCKQPCMGPSTLFWLTVQLAMHTFQATQVTAVCFALHYISSGKHTKPISTKAVPYASLDRVLAAPNNSGSVENAVVACVAQIVSGVRRTAHQESIEGIMSTLMRLGPHDTLLFS
jgi:hypothetical protein